MRYGKRMSATPILDADPTDADGPTPRPLTTRDVLAMVRAGTMAEDERVELIEGELLRMSPKNRRHELVKNWLIERAVLAAGDRYRVAVEGTLYLSDETFVEPDIALVPRGTVITDLRGPDMLLIVEVSDTTARHDLVRKRRLYARHGVPEYWVIDVSRARTVVHRRPTDDDYRDVRENAEDETLTPSLASALSVRIADAE